MIINEFQKNSNEKVRVETSSFKGKEYINLRIMFKDDKDNWLYSPKGLTLRFDLMDDLKKAIDKAATKVYESLPGADPN